jgi:hypothetical protein
LITASNVTLSASARVTDDMAVSGCQLTLISPEGGTVSLNASASQPGLTSTFIVWSVTIPRFSVTGSWNVSSIHCWDFVARSVFVTPPTQLSQINPATTAFSLAQIGQGDIAAPTVTAVSISPSVINTSEANVTARVTVDWTDDLSGLRSGEVVFTAPTLAGVTATVSCRFTSAVVGAQSGSDSCDLVFPRFGAAGEWRLTSVSSVDYASRAGSEIAAGPALDVTVLQVGRADAAPPTVYSFRLMDSILNTTAAPANFVLSLNASDDTSGLSACQLSLASPSGGTVVLPSTGTSLLSGSLSQGQFAVTFTLAQFSPPGSYNLTSLTCTDLAGRSITYSSVSLAAINAASRTLPAVQQRGVGDMMPPNVTMVAFSPRSAQVGTDVIVNVRVEFTDDMAGVASCFVQFSGPHTVTMHGFASAPGTSLTGTRVHGTLSFPYNWSVPATPSSFTLSMVSCSDAFGRTRSYARSVLSSLGMPDDMQSFNVTEAEPAGPAASSAGSSSSFLPMAAGAGAAGLLLLALLALVLVRRRRARALKDAELQRSASTRSTRQLTGSDKDRHWSQSHVNPAYAPYKANPIYHENERDVATSAYADAPGIEGHYDPINFTNPLEHDYDEALYSSLGDYGQLTAAAGGAGGVAGYMDVAPGPELQYMSTDGYLDVSFGQNPVSKAAAYDTVGGVEGEYADLPGAPPVMHDEYADLPMGFKGFEGDYATLPTGGHAAGGYLDVNAGAAAAQDSYLDVKSPARGGPAQDSYLAVNSPAEQDSYLAVNSPAGGPEKDSYLAVNKVGLAPEQDSYLAVNNAGLAPSGGYLDVNGIPAAGGYLDVNAPALGVPAGGGYLDVKASSESPYYSTVGGGGVPKGASAAPVKSGSAGKSWGQAKATGAGPSASAGAGKTDIDNPLYTPMSALTSSAPAASAGVYDRLGQRTPKAREDSPYDVASHVKKP